MLALLWLGVAACTSPDQVMHQEPATCGAWTTSRFSTDSATGAFGGTSGFATGVADGIRVYSWAYQVQEMCLTTPQPDNAVQFSVELRNDAPEDFAVTGFVYHTDANPGDATQVSTVRHAGSSRVVYDATLPDLDLVPASADGKSGTILVELQLTFPTTGTSTGDLEQLRAELLSLRMETFFHPYIGP